MSKINMNRTARSKLSATLAPINVSSLVLAMEAGRTVAITYDGKFKLCEVHAIGESTKDGGVVIRVMQVDGEASRPLPAWALLRLDKVEALAISPVASQAPRTSFAPLDAQMGRIIAELAI